MNNTLDHEVRNGMLGIALELKRMSESLLRMEQHIRRIDNAVKTCVDLMEHEQENN